MQKGADAERIHNKPVRKGDVDLSFGIGRVLQSKADNVDVGQLVWGMTGWNEYAVLNTAEVQLIE